MPEASLEFLSKLNQERLEKKAEDIESEQFPCE